PYAIREQVANAIRVPPEKLVVHPVYIGGDFGGKGDFMDIAVCYFLSKKSGRPVKMIMDYGEEFVAGNPRHASIIKVKTGVKKDGTLVAHHMEFIFDSGAYGAFKPNGFLNGPHACAGPYRIPHAFIEEHMVYTNKIPCGHMRSPGDPQGFFANESQMDLVARRLGMEPAAFRKKNLMRDGDIDPIGEEVGHIKAEETLQRALQEAGYHRPKPKNVGRGVAMVQWLTNSGFGSVALTIDEKGMVTLASAMLDQGGGTYTLLCEIVAEELKVPLEKIRVQCLDTQSGIKDSGIGGSRGTRVYGNAGYDAAIKAVAEIKRLAAEEMGCSLDDLVLANGAVLHKRAERRITYPELVKAKGSPISVLGSYNDTSKVHDASMCAQIAEVEVDPETGQVQLGPVEEVRPGAQHGHGAQSPHAPGTDRRGNRHGDRLRPDGAPDDRRRQSGHDAFRRLQNPHHPGRPSHENRRDGDAQRAGAVQQHGDRRDLQYLCGRGDRERGGRRRGSADHGAADHGGEGLSGAAKKLRRKYGPAQCWREVSFSGPERH
ncbi:MAG: molybdopterin-dependent oxidoreductase, partial [Deltaproteobacteria bacterium]|nr:molybdopterin-dependent oxidoreductase [Deltaproteobacteria bacterium]